MHRLIETQMGGRYIYPRMDISTAIDRLALGESREYRPRYGHCREIAVALHDVFGGQLVAISQVPNWEQLDHVVLRLDGHVGVYDGLGKTTLPALWTQYVPDPDNPMDDYLFDVSRETVVGHPNFDRGVYNEVHRRLQDMVN